MFLVGFIIIIIIIIFIYSLQLGCHPVAVVILHVNKTWNWLLLNPSRECAMTSSPVDTYRLLKEKFCLHSYGNRKHRQYLCKTTRRHTPEDSSFACFVVAVPVLLPLFRNCLSCHINNNNNNNSIYLLQLGCYPVAMFILHVNKTWNWLLINLSREGYVRSM